MIRCSDEKTQKKVAQSLWYNYFVQSRFVAAIETGPDGKWFLVKIVGVGNGAMAGIRLRESKEYCGNHPGPCQRRVNVGKHLKRRYLEGADWVAVNDMINDCLDKLRVDADVRNTLLTVRRGRKRRTNYRMDFTKGHANWERIGDKDSDYEDYCGRKAPRSTYPEGTPGFALWKQADAHKCVYVNEHAH